MYYHGIITKAKMPDRNSGLAEIGGRRYLRLLTSACNRVLFDWVPQNQNQS